MNHSTIGIVLIGYQNDYFAADGILKDVLKGDPSPSQVMENTLNFLAPMMATQASIFITPIVFTKDYSEITTASGILKVIREYKAFQNGQKGAQLSPEIQALGDRVTIVEGKRGLNAFYETPLRQMIEQQNIDHIIFAGAVTSVCIDSSARYAYEQGLKVTILSDCTSGRTTTEQQFYCETIFPIYAQVKTSKELLAELGI